MQCMPITVAVQTGIASMSQVKCLNCPEGERYNIEITDYADYEPYIKAMRRLNCEIACCECALCSTLRKSIKRNCIKAHHKKHVKEEFMENLRTIND